MAANQVNIVSDVCNLTRIPSKIMSEIYKYENHCIGSAIHDAILNKEDVVVLNIGIGTLSVELATKECKFIPSKELKTAIKKSVDGKKDPLVDALEQSIIDKLLRICEEAL